MSTSLINPYADLNGQWLRGSFPGHCDENSRCGSVPLADSVRDYHAIGVWLAETFPPQTIVALNAAGIVPYESRLPTVDMLGLNDTHIAHAVVAGDGAMGHQKHDAGYVLSREPGVVLLGLPELTREPIHGKQLMRWFGRWWPHLPGDKALFMNAQFQEKYAPHSVQVGSRGWLTFFIRRGSEPTP